MHIIIYPNESFREAIASAFKKAGLDTRQSYQFINADPFVLSKNGREIKIVMNKIRVAFVKNVWVITEFNVIPEGNLSPVKFCGDYELLTQIDCQVY